MVAAGIDTGCERPDTSIVIIVRKMSGDDASANPSRRADSGTGGNRKTGLLAKCPHAAQPARRRSVALLMGIVAGACAVMITAVFVLAWRDNDVPLTVLLGVVLFSLLVLAMLAVRVSL